MGMLHRRHVVRHSGRCSPYMGEAGETQYILVPEDLFRMHLGVVHSSYFALFFTCLLEGDSDGPWALHCLQSLVRAIHGEFTMGHWLGNGWARRVCVLHSNLGQVDEDDA